MKPSPNLEMGMGVTTLLAGAGVPFTLHKWLQAVSPGGSIAAPGTPGDPGDRRGGFDFTYRVPKLRDWLTFYGDAFTDDEISPWRSWNKAAVSSGLYLPRIPKIPKLDLRVEGIYTDLPSNERLLENGFFYWNTRYRSGYTNLGSLIGSWIGREGQGAQAWSTYWFTPKDNLQLSFRHEKVSRLLVPGGGTLTDVKASGSFWLRSSVSLSGSVQYETWDFPVITSTRQTNVTAGVQLTFWPWERRGASDSGQARAAKAASTANAVRPN